MAIGTIALYRHEIVPFLFAKYTTHRQNCASSVVPKSKRKTAILPQRLSNNEFKIYDTFYSMSETKTNSKW